MAEKPVFFVAPARFRAWLLKNHEKAAELWVGFHKVATGKPSMTWPESVDEALCFGWIDGRRKSLGPTSYMIRFSPRRPMSSWSKTNVVRFAALAKEGRIAPAGHAAFERRAAARTDVYAYENRGRARFSPAQERTFRANRAAWSFFQSQPPSYRALATWWVVSAKKEETQARRLARLVSESAAARALDGWAPGSETGNRGSLTAHSPSPPVPLMWRQRLRGACNSAAPSST